MRFLLRLDRAYFQWKVRKYQILDKSGKELNPGHVPEIKDCPGKSRTDGHLIIGLCGETRQAHTGWRRNPALTRAAAVCKPVCVTQFQYSSRHRNPRISAWFWTFSWISQKLRTDFNVIFCVNISRRYMSNLRSFPPGSVNEYQLRLGRQRQVWLIPIADERVGVQVKLWNPLNTRAIPERFCGGDSLRRGAISSVWTFSFTFKNHINDICCWSNNSINQSVVHHFVYQVCVQHSIIT